jgi:hypothetical protein
MFRQTDHDNVALAHIMRRLLDAEAGYMFFGADQWEGGGQHLTFDLSIPISEDELALLERITEG